MDEEVKGKIIEFTGPGAIERKVRRILDLDPGKRLRAIIEDDQSAEIVGAMPAQDLLVTIKQSGEADSIQLIELASAEQLIFIGDMEWWIGDTLDPNRILYWLQLLLACGEEKVLEWLSHLDGDLFLTLLDRFVKVTKPDEGSATDDGAETLYTIDGIYHLGFYSEDFFQIVSPILLIFHAARPELYARIMEAMVWELGPETEEMAIKWRKGRLRDLGIPDIDEAVEAYRYIDTDTFWKLPEKEAPVASADSPVPPAFPIALAGDESLLLLQAMSRITDRETIDNVSWELAHLVNRILVADREDMADTDVIFRAARKVRATVNMGLEVLADGDIDKAVEIIKGRWLLFVFQVGYSLALTLARRAHRIFDNGWMRGMAESVELLDEPFDLIFKGLKAARPKWFVGEEETPYKDFLSLNEIEMAAKALDVIEYLGQFFFDELELIGPDPETWCPKDIHRVDISFGTIFRTAFCNAAAGRGFLFKPLRKNELATIIDEAFERDSEGAGRVSEEVRNDLMAYIENISRDATEKERRIRDIFVAECVDYIEEELGGIKDINDIQPEYIQGIVIAR